MVTRGTVGHFVYRNGIISMVRLMLVMVPVVILLGCSGGGEGGPAIASLSSSVDRSADLSSDLASDSIADARSPSSDGDPVVVVMATPTGATVHFNWPHASDATGGGYYVYYGKQAAEPGSCAYEASQAIYMPPATITGLEPETPYYFAVKAFNEPESPCSNEIVLVTPPAQT